MSEDTPVNQLSAAVMTAMAQVLTNIRSDAQDDEFSHSNVYVPEIDDALKKYDELRQYILEPKNTRIDRDALFTPLQPRSSTETMSLLNLADNVDILLQLADTPLGRMAVLEFTWFSSAGGGGTRVKYATTVHGITEFIELMRQARKRAIEVGVVAG